MSQRPRSKPTRGEQAARDGGEAATWSAASLVGDEYAHLSAQSLEDAAQAGHRELTQAHVLVELDGASEKLGALQDRWGGTGTGQFAGRLHEWFAETTFNTDSIEKGQDFRARMTEFATEHSAAAPHDPADLRILGADGSVLKEVQAKAVANDAARLHELAQDKYAGMTLLLPSDHVPRTDAFADARIAQADPAFLKREAYESVQQRMSDSVSHERVSSTPIDSESLRAATNNPSVLADEMKTEHEERRRQAIGEQRAAERKAHDAEIAGVVGAFLVGGLTGAAFTGAISGVKRVADVRAERMSPTAAALSVATDSGIAFAKGSYVGGAGQAMSVMADHGIIHEAIGAGAVPFAIARGSLAMGQIGLSYAKGEIDGGEAAAQSAESLTRISFVLAASIIGQAAIPIPVVGAVVGGTVGSVCATVAITGLTSTVSLAKEAQEADRILAAVEVQVAAALIVLEEERRFLDELSKQYDIAFNKIILPSLERMDEAVRVGDYDQALSATSDLIVAHQGEPLFTTVAQFDEWMTDSSTTLTLNPNPLRTAGSPSRQ